MSHLVTGNGSQLMTASRRTGAPTPRAALEEVAVMEKAIKHSADGGDIAEQLAPIIDGAAGRE